MTAPKRPLVNTEPVSDFGPVLADDGFHDPSRLDGDALYTPGWSELRRERDLQYAEYVQGTRRGQDVMSLPVNVRLVRRTAADWKTSDGTKLLRSVNNGYRPVTASDIGQPWFTALPPGAREQPDGTIVNVAGDLQYVVADAAIAGRNAQRKAVASQQQIEASAAGSDGLLRVGAQVKGAQPTAGVE